MAGLTGFFEGVDRFLDPSTMKDIGKPDAGSDARRAKYYGQESTAKKAAPLDKSLYPDAVPGGYAITPKHARNASGGADRTWLHPDLPGPSTNRVGQDYDPKQPGTQGSGDPRTYRPVNTTQSGNTPIVTRSHNEEYVQKKAQWGDNPAVRDAADRGFAVGQAYLAGDPLADTPDYIRPGSEEWQGRADSQVWMEANPEAAAALIAKTKRRDIRAGRATSGSGSVTFSEDPTDNWKKLTGAEKIYDFQTVEDKKTRGATTEWKSSRMGDMIGAVQDGIMKTRAGVDPRAAAGQGAAIAVEESAITDVMDQNPGARREDAVAMIRSGRAAKPGVAARTGASGNQLPDYVIDGMMERHGQKRNPAIDMVRSEEPGAFLEMGKRHMEPGQNRANTFGGSAQRAHARQAAFTGTQENGPSMQMPSGLTGFAPQKAPLRNEQGNIYSRADGDLQETDDHISPDAFLYEASQHVGREMFGPEYSPARARPQF